MAAMSIINKRNGPYISELLVSYVPAFWRKHFHIKNIIMGCEMLAPLAFLRSSGPKLRGKRINLYIDNNSAAGALIRGDCSNPTLAATVCVFWEIAEAYSIDIWIGRAPSKLNIADIPTRKGSLPFPSAEQAQFRNLYKLLLEMLVYKA